MPETKPIQFSDLNLNEDLLSVVQELGFTAPTPIQSASIPPLLDGKDLVGQSQTGSGKTAAFALPLLNRIDPESRRIQALVLCPTRELSEQVAREIRKLARKIPGLQVLLTTGGSPPKPQGLALEKGVHVVVGTPGRVLDHINRGRMDLSRIFMLVLDEADRMLDMGFEDDMKAIMEEAPGTRQTVFFSATFPPFISSLSKKFQDNPVIVKVGDAVEEVAPIRQVVYEARDEEKTRMLLRLFAESRPRSAIVFCNHKATVDRLHQELTAKGIKSDGLHGDLEQRDRDRVMAKFRNLSTRVLVATDVASRGLDIKGLDLVVNYDLPHQTEIYVHRIGRTGRAGSSGVAVSLLNPQERSRYSDEFLAVPGIEGEKAKTFALLGNAPGSSASPSTTTMRTIVISGGRKDKLRPGDILGALTGEGGGLKADQVGKIEIHDTFTYVAVASQYAEGAVQKLRAGKIKNRRFSIKFAD